MSTGLDQSLLEAALVGYELQLERITAQIAQVKGLMGGAKTAKPAAAAKPKAARKKRKGRVVSAEARQKMADAQKKRWAKVRAAAAKKG